LDPYLSKQLPATKSSGSCVAFSSIAIFVLGLALDPAGMQAFVVHSSTPQ
jgi:hypothetical protein